MEILMFLVSWFLIGGVLSYFVEVVFNHAMHIKYPIVTPVQEKVDKFIVFAGSFLGPVALVMLLITCMNYLPKNYSVWKALTSKAGNSYH